MYQEILKKLANRDKMEANNTNFVVYVYETGCV